jgi:release factor glutamine methyltransferase
MLEAELLLRYLLRVGQAQLCADLRQEATSEQIRGLNHLLQRRIEHEPTAYITGHKEFFGIDLYVDHRVFIPRPETELLVEQALELANGRSSVIADIGTGCGAIAIALALNLLRAEVYATDLSAAALEVAAINCHRRGINGQIHLLQGNLLDPIPQPLDLIVANLPYVRDADMSDLSPEIRLFEPLLALAGGCDGLRWMRELLSQAGDRLCPGGAILLELSPEQGTLVSEWAKELFPLSTARLVPDLSGQERVLLIETD